MVASAETRAELAVVLARPLFGLDAAGVAARLAEHDRVAAVRAAAAGACTLRCTDADDQKFLDLSVSARVQLLVTKDRALLRMAARMQRSHGLRIARPADL